LTNLGETFGKIIGNPATPTMPSPNPHTHPNGMRSQRLKSPTRLAGKGKDEKTYPRGSPSLRKSGGRRKSPGEREGGAVRRTKNTSRSKGTFSIMGTVKDSVGTSGKRRQGLTPVES